MQCPRCGEAVSGGKFCAKCGAPLAQPQIPQQGGYPPGYQQQAAAYQPQPMPMQPPKKGGKVGLWIGLGVGALVLVVGAFLLFGGDDGPTPRPTPTPTSNAGPSNGKPAAATEPAGAVTAFLQARIKGDLAAAYSMLSPQARAMFTQAEFTQRYEGLTVASIGAAEVVLSQDPFYRVSVKNVAYADGTALPSQELTVQKADGGFWVVVEGPLFQRMDTLYTGKQYEDLLKLAGQILAMNPFSYDAYYNEAWALIELQRFPEAHKALDEAAKYVAPMDQPALLYTRGIAFGRGQQWPQAVQYLEEALKQALQYPDDYDDNWVVDAETDLARAYNKAGRGADAMALAVELHKSGGKEASAGLSFLQRKPYKVEAGMATYKLFRHDISFALPEDWVVSSETTGGDWWFARHPGSAESKTDFAVYFHGDYVGTNLDEALQGVLKRMREPIGSPPRDVTIDEQKQVAISGQPAMLVSFSDGSLSLLLQSGAEWVDFHWYNNPASEEALMKWIATVQVGE